MSVSLRNGREYGKLWVQVLSEVHDGGDVAAAVAVIGSAPDRDDGLVFEVPLYASFSFSRTYSGRALVYLVAFIDELMSTGDKLETVDVIEFCSDLIAKQPPSPTRRYSPCPNFFRIAPDEIAEGAFVGYLLSTSNNAYLVKGTDFRTQTTVDAKYFAVNDRPED